MEESYFYIIKDEFFTDFPDPNLKGNKKENRPHYFALKDKETGLFWMIPMSSKVQKYQRIIDSRKKRGVPCDILHILKIAGTESVFVIQDIFPISEKYIKRHYEIDKKPLRLYRESDIAEIEKKASKIINLRRKGVCFTPEQADIIAIEKKLIE